MRVEELEWRRRKGCASVLAGENNLGSRREKMCGRQVGEAVSGERSESCMVLDMDSLVRPE